MKDGPPVKNPLFDENGKLKATVHHNLVTIESLRDPWVRDQIPTLQQALEAWRFNNDTSLLQTRLIQLPRAHTPMDFVTTVYEHLTRGEFPLIIVNHEPSFSATENIEALADKRDDILATLQTDRFPQILKTVSVKFSTSDDYKMVLVSGVGDFRVEKGLKRKIATELDLPISTAKNATVNPSDFDTTLWLGLIPGMVKPIIQPHLIGNVSGVFYLRTANPSDFVVVSVSPIDSMILKVKHFEAHLRAYARAFYRGFEFHRTQELDIYKNRRYIKGN